MHKKNVCYHNNHQVTHCNFLHIKILLQVAEVGRLTVSTKKVESDLKKAKGTGSIEEGKLVSEFIHISQQNLLHCTK